MHAPYRSFAIWIALSLCTLASAAFPTEARSIQTDTRLLTVRQVQLLCAHGAGSHSVRARGYYASYPFFGPGPPATPISYQTGYLFGRRARTPIDSATVAARILVLGPHYGIGPQLPAAGWVQITGTWHCSTLRLRLKSWRPAARAQP